MSPLLKVPLMLASKFLFGFVTKIILLWLDSWDKEPTNTLGWNFHGQKPKVE
jgi:hypothetical protein